MVNEIDASALAYYAGFFDAEGHVEIRSKASLKITVVNTYKPILEELKALYGGGIYTTANKKNGYTEAWQWSLSSVEARQFLLDILPYLKQKREKVELCLSVAKYQKPRRASIIIDAAS